MHELRKICDETGALLVIDEIQAGMGRTARFCHDTTASPRRGHIAKGSPAAAVAAIVSRKEIWDKVTRAPWAALSAEHRGLCAANAPSRS